MKTFLYFFLLFENVQSCYQWNGVIANEPENCSLAAGKRYLKDKITTFLFFLTFQVSDADVYHYIHRKTSFLRPWIRPIRNGRRPIKINLNFVITNIIKVVCIVTL